MKAVVLVIVAAVAAVAVLPNVALADCSQTVDACQETFFLNGQAYSFDLNALCNETEYVAQDAAQHTWRFNICSSTVSNCYPATWDEVYDNGAAIQYWGATPACTVPGCRDYDTDQPICCTANCEVVAHGDPALTLIDPNNPATGGVMLSFRAGCGQRMVPDPSDPNFCETDPVTGRPYGRQVRYVISCNQNADNLIVTNIHTNSTNDCSYTIYMQSSAACACVPDCSNSECGWDGCTSVCGDCDLGTVCMPDGTCCQPDCLDANCGADGCGGSCGACPDHYICDSQSSICVLNEQVTTPSNGGAVAGAFFGGMAAAGFLGFVVYWLRFRNRGARSEAAASFAPSGNKYGSL